MGPAATPPPPPSATILRPGLVAAGGGVLVLVGMHLIASVVTLVALSALVAALLAPAQAALLRRGWPGIAALLACLAAYVGVLAAAGLILAIGLAGFLRDLPTYEGELEAAFGRIAVALGGQGTPPPADAAAIGAAITEAARGLAGSLATLGYSVFVVAYLLLEAPRAGERLRWAFGATTTTVARGAALAERLRSYIVARAVLGAVAAILDTALLLVLGVPAALLWGVLSFLLSFIPNVGFVLALIPPTVLGLLTGGPLVAVAVIAGYSIINVAIDYVVQPRFIGGSVDISPVVVTVCLLFWAAVLGGAGALLAVPLTIVAAAVFDAFDDTRPIARLLGDKLGLPSDGPGDQAGLGEPSGGPS